MATSTFPYANEPWAPYYLHHNPGWDKPRDAYSRWKLVTSRKATAIATWELREQARSEYAATFGADPEGWRERHVTVVVFPTNAPEAVCIECAWIDGSHWEDRGARAAGRVHTLTASMRQVSISTASGQPRSTS